MTTPPPRDAGLRHGLILTAGLGTRLRPLTLVRAKPALPVGGEPIIRRIVRQMTDSGIRDLVLNLHYLPETIAAVVGDGSDLGACIRYSWEHPRVLGSAGGPRLALDLIDAETFVIANGDTLTDVDLAALCAHHRDHRAHVTLALTPNHEPDRYGGVRLAPGGRVLGFVARGAAARGSHHFLGVQVVNRRVFESVPLREPASTIGGIYDRLIATCPEAVHGFVSQPSFWDVGTVDTYVATSHAFATDASAERGQGAHIAPEIGRAHV